MGCKSARYLTATVGLGIALALSGCTDPAVSDAMKAIDAIGEVTLESAEAIEAANEKYEALDSEKKEQVENYGTLESANDDLSKLLYSEISEALEKFDSEKTGYFASRYDLAELNAVAEDAREALESSDEEAYVDIHEAIKEELSEFERFVKDERRKSYSVDMGEDPAFPFAVPSSTLPTEWSLKPAVMQTSSHPNWVLCEKEAADLPPYVNFFINGSSRDYAYEVASVPTKTISVQNEDGEIVEALVNTEVRFTAAFEQWANNDPNKELNERPGYFFVDRDFNCCLALQNYDGEDYYVIYR